MSANTPTIENTEQREARIEATKETLRTYLKKFKAAHKALTVAERHFREQTDITWQEPRTLVMRLQTLRKQANACLAFLHSDTSLLPDPAWGFLTSNLEPLDGEATARLILEMDLFETTLIRQGYHESLTEARERIDLHVGLESGLKEEARLLETIIATFEKVLARGTIGG